MPPTPGHRRRGQRESDPTPDPAGFPCQPRGTFVDSLPKMLQPNRLPPRLRASRDAGASNSGHLRQLNLARVLGVVMDRPNPFTRTELIEATGLSAPTVGSLVSHLIRSGVVRDLGVGPSSGGRRPSFMDFNARYGFVAGIDLGPTKTRLALADLRGEQLAHHVLPTLSDLGPAALLSRVATSVRALMREARVVPGRLLSVGAGAPGAVDRGGPVLALAPNLQRWLNVPMAAMLERSLRGPVVV